MAGNRQEVSHLMSTYYAPRGRQRIFELGMQLAQMYLKPQDRLIGIIGEPGSGKSALVKGMFPGLELTNDDDGVNVRPLPILGVEDEMGFFTPHTYHLDIRFETGFTQLPMLADAIMAAVHKGKRVVCEHFELIYPLLPINADLLIGVGEEILVARPTLFGPEPSDIYDVVCKSLNFRLMAHTAEDLVEHYLVSQGLTDYTHGDVRHGFTIIFPEKPQIDPRDIESYVLEKVAQKLPVSYYDETHIKIGDELHHCTGPRTHVRNTEQIENFNLLWDYIYDHVRRDWILVGAVGEKSYERLRKLRDMQKWDDFPQT